MKKYKAGLLALIVLAVASLLMIFSSFRVSATMEIPLAMPSTKPATL